MISCFCFFYYLSIFFVHFVVSKLLFSSTSCYLRMPKMSVKHLTVNSAQFLVTVNRNTCMIMEKQRRRGNGLMKEKKKKKKNEDENGEYFELLILCVSHLTCLLYPAISYPPPNSSSFFLFSYPPIPFVFPFLFLLLIQSLFPQNGRRRSRR